MSNDAPIRPATSRRGYRLSVNSYDRAASLLISLLVMVGVVVLAMVIVFFAQKLNLQQTAIPVMPVDPASRPADAAMGLKQDIEPPGVEDSELEEPKLQDTLDAIMSVVANKSAILSDEAIDSDTEAGKGGGLGDNRTAGTGGTGDPIDEPQRELRYEPSSLSEYAQMLDFFGIELAVYGRRDNIIYYAKNLSKEKPDVRTGKPPAERRFSMLSQGPPLGPLDRRLARKAGISQYGNVIIQYYPRATEILLLTAEKAKAGNKAVSSLRKTVFQVVRQGSNYSFKVEEQY